MHILVFDNIYLFPFIFEQRESYIIQRAKKENKKKIEKTKLNEEKLDDILDDNRKIDEEFTDVDTHHSFKIIKNLFIIFIIAHFVLLIYWLETFLSWSAAYSSRIPTVFRVMVFNPTETTSTRTGIFSGGRKHIKRPQKY